MEESVKLAYMTQKLYRIVLRGCRELKNGVDPHEGYVVAASTDEAYTKFRDKLAEENTGTPEERELHMLYLIAEDSPKAAIGLRLFL